MAQLRPRKTSAAAAARVGVRWRRRDDDKERARKEQRRERKREARAQFLNPIKNVARTSPTFLSLSTSTRSQTNVLNFTYVGYNNNRHF